jgi:hypothetical protein
MNEQADVGISIEFPADIRNCFLPGVRFVDAGTPGEVAGVAVRVGAVDQGSDEPGGLSGDVLPFLALPTELSLAQPIARARVVVAVEGRDELMADVLAALLDPERVTLSLVHVTWVPGIAGSPLDRGGLDNPQASDLLAYQGAREALIGTTTELHRYRFEVSTHLRESRDPAQAIAVLIEDDRPMMFALGLGRHGAGIGRRVMERIRVPTLFVRAR